MHLRRCRTPGCGKKVECKHKINLHCDDCEKKNNDKWKPLLKY